MSEPAAATAVNTAAVVVRLGDSRFAVPMNEVVEVARLPAITRVPGMPDWIRGVVNWRGRVLPVLVIHSLVACASPTVDTAARKSPLSKEPDQARLVVVAGPIATIGIQVDEVVTTISFTADETAALPAGLPPGAGGLIAGQITRSDGPLAVLSVDGLQRLRDAVPRGRRSA